MLHCNKKVNFVYRSLYSCKNLPRVNKLIQPIYNYQRNRRNSKTIKIKNNKRIKENTNVYSDKMSLDSTIYSSTDSITSNQVIRQPKQTLILPLLEVNRM